MLSLLHLHSRLISVVNYATFRTMNQKFTKLQLVVFCCGRVSIGRSVCTTELLPRHISAVKNGMKYLVSKQPYGFLRSTEGTLCDMSGQTLLQAKSKRNLRAPAARFGVSKRMISKEYLGIEFLGFVYVDICRYL